MFLQLSENKTVEIKRTDIEELQTFALNADHAGVMLRLKVGAADKLTALTEPFVGKTILWVWNGRVISAVKLALPLSKDVNILNFTTQEACEFTKSVPISTPSNTI